MVEAVHSALWGGGSSICCDTASDVAISSRGIHMEPFGGIGGREEGEAKEERPVAVTCADLPLYWMEVNWQHQIPF